MARPSIINNRLIEKFCSALRLSTSILTAIAETGIGRTTYYRWARAVHQGGGTKWERKFMRAVEKAEGEVKLRYEYMLSRHIEKSWRAIAWWLERKYPDEYGRRRPRPLSDGDDPREREDLRQLTLARLDRILGGNSSAEKNTTPSPITAATPAMASAPEGESLADIVWTTEAERALEGNERVVTDWFVDANDRLTRIRNRITSDPCEKGRNYNRGADGQEIEDPKAIRIINGRLLRAARKSEPDTSIRSRDGVVAEIT